MSIESYLVAALAVVITGISKSGFAGGLGILGVPLVSLTIPLQDAVILLLPILVVIDVLSVWRYRKSWQAQAILALLPGASVGIGLGMMGFSLIDPDLLRMLVGGLALFFVGSFLRQRIQRRRNSPLKTENTPWIVFAAGALSGLAGFVAHAGGPPVKGTFLRMNMDKAAFVGTNAVFFFVLNLAKALGYAGLGLFSVQSFTASATLAPFLLAGVLIGFALHDRVPQHLFVTIAYVFLALAGVNLIGSGIAGLLA